MRDNLIHRYDNIDLDEVWKTSNEDMPTLLNALNSLIDWE
jgi:uncharacterized protein with HEPN domain